MKLENLNLHLENLLPGIVILSGILMLIPSSSDSISLMVDLRQSEFLLSVLFLTVSYLLGLISAVISRAILDDLSELFPRPMILMWRSRKNYNELVTLLKSHEISLPTILIVKQSIWNKDYRIAWNRAYREALATVIRDGPEKGVADVQRRREQGRLVRNLLFPLVIGTWVVVQELFQIENPWVIIPLCVLAFIGSVLLYAYAEYFNFAEAVLVLREKSRGDVPQ